MYKIKRLHFFVTTWWVLGKHIQLCNWTSVDGVVVMLGQILGNEFFQHEIAFILSWSMLLKVMSYLFFYSLIVHLEVQMALIWLNVGLIFLSLYVVIFCYCVLPEQMYCKQWLLEMCSHETAAFLFVLLSDIHSLERPKRLCRLPLL